VSLYSRFVNEVEAEALYSLILLGELKEVLSMFKLDKSPGPNGWTVEFFVHFFDMVAGDLLEMVEALRLKGIISRGLNSIFLALIPKLNKPHFWGF
jgi:hypothetical protein